MHITWLIVNKRLPITLIPFNPKRIDENRTRDGWRTHCKLIPSRKNRRSFLALSAVCAALILNVAESQTEMDVSPISQVPDPSWHHDSFMHMPVGFMQQTSTGPKCEPFETRSNCKIIDHSDRPDAQAFAASLSVLTTSSTSAVYAQDRAAKPHINNETRCFCFNQKSVSSVLFGKWIDIQLIELLTKCGKRRICCIA